MLVGARVGGGQAGWCAAQCRREHTTVRSATVLLPLHPSSAGVGFSDFPTSCAGITVLTRAQLEQSSVWFFLQVGACMHQQAGSLLGGCNWCQRQIRHGAPGIAAPCVQPLAWEVWVLWLGLAGNFAFQMPLLPACKGLWC